jgi:glycosyltransferase involved in cell wall biosynthesis
VNIALLTEALVGGGAEAIVGQLALGLTRRGHRTFVYCLRAGGPPVELLRPHGVVVREAHSVGFDPGLGWRLLTWMRRDRIEVVSAHNSAATFWALLAAKVLGIPLIQTRHGALLGPPTRYTWLMDRLTCFVDRVGIVEESLRRSIPIGHARRQAVHLPNGIDRERIDPDEARRELERLCNGHGDGRPGGRPLPDGRPLLSGPIVLTVGTICPEKDQRGLLRAVAILRCDFPDIRLVVAGGVRDADYDRQLRRDEQDLGLHGHVHWLGPVEQAHRLMAGADVFCLPSRTEAMPLALIEAMSQHVPIVATAVGGVGALPDPNPGIHAGVQTGHLLRHADTALLVPPGEPATLAAALGYALHDRPAAAERATRAAADYTGSFTAARMVRRYENVFAECRGLRNSDLRIANCEWGLAKGESIDGHSRPRTRPRVLMVGPRADQIGGIASVVSALMNSPLRRSFELYRFAPERRTEAAARPIAASPHRERPAATSAAMIRMLRGVLARSGRLSRAVLRHARGLCDLARIIRRRHIDIVHIHTCSFFSFYRSLLDLMIARWLRRRACLHIHGSQFPEFCAASHPLARRLIRWGCETADRVVVLSKYWETQLRPYIGRGGLAVVPNGVEPLPEPWPTVTTPHPGHTCRFLYLGALVAQKGLVELIEAAALLREAGVRFELLLAGPAIPADRARWEQCIRALRLQSQVRILDPVQGSAKEELLASVDCLVLPSYNEGLPMVVLEAAARGLPVIATAVGALPEFVKPVGDARTSGEVRPLAPLIPPRDVPSLAREMARLAGDAHLRRTIGDRLRAHVAANYSVAHQARCLAKLYDEMLGRPPVDVRESDDSEDQRPALSSQRLASRRETAECARLTAEC